MPRRRNVRQLLQKDEEWWKEDEEGFKPCNWKQSLGAKRWKTLSMRQIERVVAARRESRPVPRLLSSDATTVAITMCHMRDRTWSKKFVEEKIRLMMGKDTAALDLLVGIREAPFPHGKFIIAGSYPDFLAGNLKSYNDLDLWSNDLISMRYMFKWEEFEEVSERIQSRPIRGATFWPTCFMVGNGVNGLGENGLPEDDEHGGYTKLTLKRGKGKRVQKIPAVPRRNGRVNLIIYDHLFRHRGHPLCDSELIVSLFHHAVTKTVLEFIPALDAYLLREESVVGKQSILRQGGSFADTYPFKHYNNTVNGVRPNKLRDMAYMKIREMEQGLRGPMNNWI